MTAPGCAELGGPDVIAAWFTGGLFLLFWKPQTGSVAIAALTTRHAVIIGAAQILALWPGVSRSLTTIAAAVAIGATMSVAVEFSFLLGRGTLSAATIFDLTKSGSTLVANYGIVTPMLGTVVAFATAFVAARLARGHPAHPALVHLWLVPNHHCRRSRWTRRLRCDLSLLLRSRTETWPPSSLHWVPAFGTMLLAELSDKTRRLVLSFVSSQQAPTDRPPT